MYYKSFVAVLLLLAMFLAAIPVGAESSLNLVFSGVKNRGEFKVLEDNRAEASGRLNKEYVPLPYIRIEGISRSKDPTKDGVMFFNLAYLLDMKTSRCEEGKLPFEKSAYVPEGGRDFFSDVTSFNLKSLKEDLGSKFSNTPLWTCWGPQGSLVVVDDQGSHVYIREANTVFTISEEQIFRLDYLGNGMLAALTLNSGHGTSLLILDEEFQKVYEGRSTSDRSWGQLSFINEGRQILMEEFEAVEQEYGAPVENYIGTRIFDVETNDSWLLDLKHGGFRSFNNSRSLATVVAKNRKTFALFDYSNPKDPKLIIHLNAENFSDGFKYYAITNAAVSGDGSFFVFVVQLENEDKRKANMFVFDIAGNILFTQEVSDGRGLFILENRFIVLGTINQLPPYQKEITGTGAVSIFELEW